MIVDGSEGFGRKNFKKNSEILFEKVKKINILGISYVVCLMVLMQLENLSRMLRYMNLSEVGSRKCSWNFRESKRDI